MAGLKNFGFIILSISNYFVMVTLASSVSHGSAISSESGTNLTKITWAHAVNNKSFLNSTLHSTTDMIEADIVLGRLISNLTAPSIPIMGHPPIYISDLSLEDFLNTVNEHNTNFPDNAKGVKLDFKSIDVFLKSTEIVSKMYNTANFDIWINADILSGPVDAQTTPVNAKEFLQNAKQFQKSILSIGWTTRYTHDDDLIKNGTYTEQQINQMLETIKNNTITQEITFPVRAGIAAQSFEQMKKLVDDTANSTITIWSSQNDEVDVEKLRKLIFGVGLDKTYVDVPEDLKEKLRLDEPVE